MEYATFDRRSSLDVRECTCMKKACCLAALTLLPLLCCPSVRAEETNSQLTAASLSNTAGATGDIAQLLLGHWVANNGTTHYYFGQEEVVIVNLLRQRDNSIAQHKQKLEYEITAINDAWVQLELQTPLGWAQTRFLRMADDRQSLTELMNVMGHSFRNDWTFVDDRQQP
ncbi:MAG: hypothetical protein F6K28_54275 [Microcoleus sp. SIO2G3]|nr:hypothetical protein [Microcoleus sp. SIO2G3]